MKTILLDMDGVLVDLYGPLFEAEGWAEEFKPGADVLESHGVMFQRMFWEKYKAKFWANLPKTPECDYIINHCLRVFGKRDICICSAPVNSACAKGKIQWIEKYYPWMKYILTKEKYACSGYLIDDDVKNTPTILFPRPWNENHNKDPMTYFLEKFNANFQ